MFWYSLNAATHPRLRRARRAGAAWGAEAHAGRASRQRGAALVPAAACTGCMMTHPPAHRLR
eukprot:6538909-Prymnesium_polylepis.1